MDSAPPVRVPATESSAVLAGGALFDDFPMTPHEFVQWMRDEA